MELKDYNLKVVTVNDRGCALQPISTCTINNKKYTCNTDETEEEKIFIPIEDLKFGCYMSIKPLKKAYIIKIRQLFWRWYIEIWDIPYKEDDTYSKLEIFEFMKTNPIKDSFPMK